MKKIGILTMNGNENYGNRLQNYATQEVLRKLGYATETIINTTSVGIKDVTAPDRSRLYKLKPNYIAKVLRSRANYQFNIKNDSDGLIRAILWRLRHYREVEQILKAREKAFAQFTQRYILNSSFSITVDELPEAQLEGYDYFVCGSDQIWNPYYSKTSMIDFLHFAPKSKRISYAPSFGVSSIPDHKKILYSHWINAIPNLSVREKKGADIIKELTGREAVVLVDPTLMLDKEEWLFISKKPDMNIDKKFILTYFIGNETRAYKRFIDKMAKRLSCIVINLLDIRELESYAVDPSEFIYLIANATLVCTDSFHGTVFSIIMRTNFIVFDRVDEGHSMGSRLETLLERLSLQKRYLNNITSHEDVISIDFSGVENIINFEKEKSIGYLKSALNH